MFNLPVVAAFRTRAREADDPVARAAMATMLGLTVMDAVTAIGLRRTESAR